MSRANIFEVKARLSEYLDRALKGERVVICRHNKPVAELRAIEPVRLEPRPIGPIAGRPTFEIPPSFFEPLDDDEMKAWEGMSSADPLSAVWPAHVPDPTARVAERPPEGERGVTRRRARRRP